MQYAKAISARILNRLICISDVTAKAPTKTDVLVPDRPRLCCPEKIRVRSPAKVFCRLIQSLYSSTGTGPMREQAKKPFRIFRAVVLKFALPLWYSMATSNTATTTPAANRDQPNRVNSRMVASTQPRVKISAPMFPMLVKNRATAS